MDPEDTHLKVQYTYQKSTFATTQFGQSNTSVSYCIVHFSYDYIRTA